MVDKMALPFQRLKRKVFFSVEMRTLEQHPKIIGKMIFMNRRSQMFFKVAVPEKFRNIYNKTHVLVSLIDKVASLKAIAIKKLENVNVSASFVLLTQLILSKFAFLGCQAA